MDLDEDRLIIRKLYSFGLYTFISGLLIGSLRYDQQPIQYESYYSWSYLSSELVAISIATNTNLTTMI